MKEREKIRMRAFVFLVLFESIAAAIAYGKGPEIDGPESVKVGGKCILKVAEATDCKIGWRLPKNMKDGAEAVILNDGQLLVFFTGSGGGTYEFSLAVCEADDNEIYFVDHILTVEGAISPMPPKPPPVNPPAPPEPPVNPGERFGLTALVHAAAVANDNGPPDSVLLAAAYKSVAAQTHASVQAMATAQKLTNRRVLGDRANAWAGWGTTLAAALSDLQRAGKLVSLADHVVAWKEIAAGLEAVK